MPSTIVDEVFHIFIWTIKRFNDDNRFEMMYAYKRLNPLFVENLIDLEGNC
jgi:hypothetical protein